MHARLHERNPPEAEDPGSPAAPASMLVIGAGDSFACIPADDLPPAAGHGGVCRCPACHAAFVPSDAPGGA